MNRETNEPLALIDLGAASVETQGDGSQVIDLFVLQDKAGISDD
jgi:hypothetical protein